MGVQVFPSIQFSHLTELIATEPEEGLHETVARVVSIPLSVSFAEPLQKAFFLVFMAKAWLVWDVFEGDDDLMNLD